MTAGVGLTLKLCWNALLYRDLHDSPRPVTLCSRWSEMATPDRRMTEDSGIFFVYDLGDCDWNRREAIFLNCTRNSPRYFHSMSDTRLPAPFVLVPGRGHVNRFAAYDLSPQQCWMPYLRTRWHAGSSAGTR